MSKIAIIGEAWGEAEERARTAFVGNMSAQLTPMLQEAGIHRANCHLTNVFNLRYDGKIELFCGPKATAIPGYPGLGKSLYVRREFQPELDRLAEELVEINPNLIIAMGNTPLWALCGKTGIKKWRGTTMPSTHTVSGFKVLPTYHPAAIIHQWPLRPIAVMDLTKAAREAEYPEIRRPAREIWIEPTIEDINVFCRTHARSSGVLSVDIETAGNQITCIGLAPSPRLGIVIPFLDTRRKGRCYWPSTRDEQQVWRLVADVLADRSISKIFQNGLYDIAFLWRAYRVKVVRAEHDTMLLHHALHPEALKALGFLGSIYTEEGAWKADHRHSATVKAGA